MEFLVHIEVRLPADMDSHRREGLLAAEAKRGRELLASGALKRIWRLPGRLANISLYDVPDATTLHSLISSLPLWLWMEVEVQPLAIHPLESDPPS
jgi:muconolactone D-isomerase